MLVKVADSASIAAMDRLDLLAGELSAAPSATFVDLSLAQRQVLVDELEQAFLDPGGALREVAGTVPTLRTLQDPETVYRYLERASEHASPEVAAAAGELAAKVAGYHSLTDIDWPISLDDLRRSDLAATVNRFADVRSHPQRRRLRDLSTTGPGRRLRCVDPIARPRRPALTARRTRRAGRRNHRPGLPANRRQDGQPRCRLRQHAGGGGSARVQGGPFRGRRPWVADIWHRLRPVRDIGTGSGVARRWPQAALHGVQTSTVNRM
jgi:hypothetical protein